MPPNIKIDSKIFSNDYQKEIGSLSIPLPMNGDNGKATAGIFAVTYTTEEQSISNFINLLLTRQGERIMQPNFGVGLHWYLFEQSTSDFKLELETSIREQARKYLPYIMILNLRLDALEHQINISIDFRVTNSGANRTVTIFTNEDRNINVEVI